MAVPDEQLALAQLLLSELSDFSFAIAGGVAVRLNGYVERPTEDLELGRDWREHPTRSSQWGPVLHPRDSAASKCLALWARREVRDAIDVGAMIASGDFTTDELIGLLRENDEGFGLETFIPAIQTASRYPDAEFLMYDILPERAEEYRSIFAGWSSRVISQIAESNVALRVTDGD